jgi:hypothetical protein
VALKVGGRQRSVSLVVGNQEVTGFRKFLRVSSGRTDLVEVYFQNFLESYQVRLRW